MKPCGDLRGHRRGIAAIGFEAPRCKALERWGALRSQKPDLVEPPALAESGACAGGVALGRLDSGHQCRVAGVEPGKARPGSHARRVKQFLNLRNRSGSAAESKDQRRLREHAPEALDLRIAERWFAKAPERIRDRGHTEVLDHARIEVDPRPRQARRKQWGEGALAAAAQADEQQVAMGTVTVAIGRDALCQRRWRTRAPSSRTWLWMGLGSHPGAPAGLVSSDLGETSERPLIERWPSSAMHRRDEGPLRRWSPPAGRGCGGD